MAVLAYAAVSLAVSYLASRLLGQQDKSIAVDDKPTTVSTRGAYLPVVIGRDRMGPIFGWAGDRKVKKEKSSGGKGGSTPRVRIYYEAGWHQIAVGPGARLYRIRDQGKVIFEGPIDPVTHPSGSTISLGKDGSFRIYWGEPDGPVNGPPDLPLNESLGSPTRVGISSRWPGLMYVHWIERRLGTSPQWGLIDYEFEVRPTSSLTQSAAWIEATRTLTGSTYPVFIATNGGPGVAHIEISGDHTQTFKNGGFLHLVGCGTATDGDYRIASSEYTYSTGIPPSTVLINRTKIVLEDYLVGGANLSGTVQAYSLADDDGVNLAHAIWQLLFARWPLGAARDQSSFNMDSLEEIGQLCEAERLIGRVRCVNGAQTSAVITGLMQDIGVFLGMDDTGKLRFKAIRQVDPLLIPAITSDMIVAPVPQVETNHAEITANRSVYVFKDRKRGFRDMPIAVDDNGNAEITRRATTKKTELINIIDYLTAARVSERRDQEDVTTGVAYRITTNRATRRMFPGQAFTFAGLPGVMRVSTVQPDTLSSKVSITAIKDYYGVPASGFVNSDGGGNLSPVRDPERDLALYVVEIPSYISPGEQRIGFPRIRAHEQVMGADIWISRDDITYEHQGQDFDVQTGGALLDPLASTDPTLMAVGPRIAALGPDIATVRDLNSDPINWRLGRQLAVIVSGGETEICFLQSITAIGGGVYRLNGLLRARYDTRRLNHVVGSYVLIFDRDSILTETDILLAPGLALFAKSQPFTSESYPLSSVVPTQTLLRGKGIVPMDTENLRTANLSNSYRAGQSIEVRWAYRSPLLPKTGAGMQAAGFPCGVSEPEGQFFLRFLTSGGTLRREIAVTIPSYSYSNAQLIADFSGEPTSLKVELRNANGGYSSTIREITIVKV